MRLIKIIFIVTYLISLFYIVFFARRRESMHLLQRYQLVNKRPVVNKVNEYRYLNFEKNKREIKNFFINIFGNVLLFIPLPLVLTWISGGIRPRQLLIVAFLMSVGIECIQFLLKSGVADVDDIILNTSGAAIGILFLTIVPKHFLRLHTLTEIENV